ncbi:MAG: FAD binding domain-containing protein [Pyrinomonadaceae bacterium]
MKFILNNETISTDLPAGTTVLDFVRYHQNLKGTKIGCREGDCGACTILVGELVGEGVRYRSMTSCLMPLANAAGRHIVTVEGINPEDGSLTPVQAAMVEASGTQCGFCTVGFVMSLTGYCLESAGSPSVSSPHVSKGSASSLEAAVSAIDGNICRCTGYKSIERAACRISEALSEPPASAGGQKDDLHVRFVPEYFSDIAARLMGLNSSVDDQTGRPLTQAVLTGGGTDLYVQRPEEMAERGARTLLYDDELRTIIDTGEYIELGASVTVTDLLESPVMQSIFPDLYKHLKLVSSTPIRNMATLAGNFVNASPIGDMTAWFLALDAEIELAFSTGRNATVRERAASLDISNGHASAGDTRRLKLKDLYLGYKQLAKTDDEIITTIRFRKPTGDFRFNFEKVSKRTYLDIASVNTAMSLVMKVVNESEIRNPKSEIEFAHVSAGGVAPIPLYLKETSAFLRGKPVTAETISQANEIIQTEISPISDVRGSAEYKRLLLRQLFTAHFAELFEI